MKHPLVLVVGMHRSGTSLLAGILQSLGIHFPGQAIAADIHNPDGYFEWDDVVAIQERLLIDLDRWWPSSQGTFPLPDSWLLHPSTLVARKALLSLLQHQVSQQSCVCAIKDPRTSRLLPLWFDLADELDIPVQILLAIRDPAEVTTSLLRRDGPITGLDLNRAQQLWWRHNLEVIEATRTYSKILTIVDFDSWFDDPKQHLSYLIDSVAGLNPSSDQFNQALLLIKPKYRRSIHNSDPHALYPSVRRLYKRLLRRPLPIRMPSSTPPRKLLRDFSEPLNGHSLASCPEHWDDWLTYHRNYPAPKCTSYPEIADHLLISILGSSWLNLNSHFFLQRLSLLCSDSLILDLTSSTTSSLDLINKSSNKGVLNRVSINLHLPDLADRTDWLARLKTQQLVFDPDPSRVLLLRSCDINAFWLDVQVPVNTWLDQNIACSPVAWAKSLGIAPPQANALIVLGVCGPSFANGLASEAISNETFKPEIQYFPGWNELIVNTVAEGLARASWLYKASNSAARLYFTSRSELSDISNLLNTSIARALFSPSSIHPCSLRHDHFGTKPFALAEDRSSPIVHEEFEWSDGNLPCASVLVSLYNYADYILNALDSVSSQTVNRLELIVVDDASSDSGCCSVLAWMRQKLCQRDHPFCRLLLLRHSINTGLASARNTAFASSTSLWCLVLDADNIIFPSAVNSCLQLTSGCEDKLAVVHPLLSVEAESGRPDEQRTLVSTASWQRSRLLGGNVVDAMALIRRAAWDDVGGYTHIQYGWEDYDFWCKLIEKGYYGVQCPSILGVYRSHPDSMSNRYTNLQWNALSSTLQSRHSWLELPFQ